ncbi:hypothetical protein B0H14DRAFT_896319 [Mycena olivaceomarginata]|nr:hypothetical protein B0H14DRAFT_896319 [Mycena olivaceomarginata]
MRREDRGTRTLEGKRRKGDSPRGGGNVGIRRRNKDCQPVSALRGASRERNAKSRYPVRIGVRLWLFRGSRESYLPLCTASDLALTACGCAIRPALAPHPRFRRSMTRRRAYNRCPAKNSEPPAIAICLPPPSPRLPSPSTPLRSTPSHAIPPSILLPTAQRGPPRQPADRRRKYAVRWSSITRG